jgi:hypothetical protein
LTIQKQSKFFPIQILSDLCGNKEPEDMNRTNNTTCMGKWKTQLFAKMAIIINWIYEGFLVLEDASFRVLPNTTRNNTHNYVLIFYLMEQQICEKYKGNGIELNFYH